MARFIQTWAGDYVNENQIAIAEQRKNDEGVWFCLLRDADGKVLGKVGSSVIEALSEEHIVVPALGEAQVLEFWMEEHELFLRRWPVVAWRVWAGEVLPLTPNDDHEWSACSNVIRVLEIGVGEETVWRVVEYDGRSFDTIDGETIDDVTREMKTRLEERLEAEDDDDGKHIQRGNCDPREMRGK